MENYIALIRKADFLDLYRYGILHINRDLLCRFTCTIEELRERKCFLNNITAFANSFDSSFTYLFIHYIKGGAPSRINDVLIEEVQGIYPLDFNAKKNLEMIDDNILINDPLWSDAGKLLQKQQSVSSCLQGARNVWRIFDIETPIEKYAETVTTDIVKETVDELFEDKRPSGGLHPLVYLLRYERHSYYPKNNIGFFLDAVNVIFNIMGGREVNEDQISNSMIYQYLMFLHQTDPSMKFDAIRTMIAQEPKVQAIVQKSLELLPGFDFLTVAAFYMLFKNQCQEDLYYDEKWVLGGKSYGEDFYLACYLLGIKLGHEHTSDCLYEKVALPILKKKVAAQTEEEPVLDSAIQPAQETVAEPATETIQKTDSDAATVPAQQQNTEDQVDETDKTKPTESEETKDAVVIEEPKDPDVDDASEADNKEVHDYISGYPRVMAILSTRGKTKGKPKSGTKTVTVNNREEEIVYLKMGYEVYSIQ